MVKIKSLELENVKRVKVVQVAPSANGLTIIGGKNGQGKTSILDAIAWALGGAKFAPTAAHREGAYNPPKLHVVLDNGIVVERSGANSTLKVTDPEGKKAGQKLLDSFIDELALNLPKFMAMNDKEKAKELLSLLGVESELTALENKEQALYSQRHELGKLATSKQKYAEELEEFDGVPSEPIKATELINRSKAILAQNAENDRLRLEADKVEQEYYKLLHDIATAQKEKERIEEQLKDLGDSLENIELKLQTAKESTSNLVDESTKEIEEELKNIEEINQKIAANKLKEQAILEAGELKKDYDELTSNIESLRESKKKLLSEVVMPIDGLYIEDGALTYKDKKWDCMSASEQLMVSTAIVKALNPNCGFVLMDKLEQMDTDTMNEFGVWLEKEGLQVIATRVSVNKDECTLIIEDGQVVEEKESSPVEEPKDNKWGDF